MGDRAMAITQTAHELVRSCHALRIMSRDRFVSGSPVGTADRKDLLEAILKDLAVMKAEAEACGLASLASLLETALSEARDLLQEEAAERKPPQAARN